MLVAMVHVHVKSEFLQEFITATLDNARNSIQEPGVERFDIYQQTEDPTQFSLIEIYRTDEAPAKHKETAHYARWRDTAEPMMVEPRRRITYHILYPPELEG